MLRVTPDIWDEQKGIDECFTAWRKWQGKEESGFWIDMDMIPFGQLQLMNPKPEGIKGDESKKELMEMMEAGKLEKMELLSGKGFKRWSQFSKDQMYTFITLRALSASPLMMGGDLPTVDEFSLSLITDKDMIECNQNSVMGSLKYEGNGIEVWNTPKKDTQDGWFGIFNRSDISKKIDLDKKQLGLKSNLSYELIDIWKKGQINIENILSLDVKPNGVVFIKYKIK